MGRRERKKKNNHKHFTIENNFMIPCRLTLGSTSSSPVNLTLIGWQRRAATISTTCGCQPATLPRQEPSSAGVRQATEGEWAKAQPQKGLGQKKRKSVSQWWRRKRWRRWRRWRPRRRRKCTTSQAQTKSEASHEGSGGEDRGGETSGARRGGVEG